MTYVADTVLQTFIQIVYEPTDKTLLNNIIKI
jgi:hypothetical protein